MEIRTNNRLLLCKSTNNNGACEYRDIGNFVEDDKNTITSINILLNTNSPYLNSLNRKLLELFTDENFSKSLAKGYLSEPKLLESENIKLVIIGFLKYTKCIGLYTIQINGNAIRYLFYVYDRTNNNRTDFVITPFDIQMEYVHAQFEEEITFFNKKVKKDDTFKSIFHPNTFPLVYDPTKCRMV